MPTQVQVRRGTTAEHSSFTGAVGELTVDTDKDVVVVHDGSTAGGRPMLRQDQSNLPTSAPSNGVYIPSSNNVAISTNSSQRLLIDASGNVNIDSNTLYVDATNNRVGLGTSSGSAKCTIDRGTYADASATGSTTFTNAALALAAGTDTNNRLMFGIGSTGASPWIQAQNTNSNTTASLVLNPVGGSVGIGSTGPQYPLDVTGAGNNGILSDGAIRAYSANRTAYATIAYNGIDASTNSGGLLFSINQSEAARIDSSRRLLIGTSSAPQSYGGASLTGLQIEKSGDTATRSLTLVSNAASNFPPSLHFGRSRGTSNGAVTAVASGDDLGGITFGGADGTTAFIQAADIRAVVDGTPGSNDMPGRLVFSTTADGASSPTERMRINSQGAVGIGLTSPNADDGRLNVAADGNGAGIGTTRLFMSGYEVTSGNAAGLWFGARNNENTGVIGSRTASGNIAFETYVSGSWGERMRLKNDGELLIGYTTDNGAYKLQVNSQIFATSATIATSDGRYKENVSALDGCLDLVKALRPVSFTWKPQEDITRIDEEGNEVLVRESHNFPEGTQVGFIAQEVQEVLDGKPWLGSVIKENVRPAVKDAEGNELAPEEQFYGIAEGNLIAVLTNALQEAVTEIESLKARVTALEP